VSAAEIAELVTAAVAVLGAAAAWLRARAAAARLAEHLKKEHP
jgi:hypothetical protein